MNRQPAFAGRVLLLVPARGGSRGIPGKNLQTVDGVSLVGRAVLAARRFLREVPLPDARVIVDTDDAAIAEEGSRWGAEVPFLRPAGLASDDTTTLASTLHLTDRLTASGWSPDALVLLQPTSPLRSWEDIAACWELHVNEERESVVSVVSPSKAPQLAMRISGDGVLHWLGPAPAPNVRRQDLTPSVAPSGAVYVTRLSALRSRAAFVVPDVTVGVERDSVRSLDVDTPADLLAARRAGQLVAPPSPTRVLTRTVSPVEDDVVVIDGTPCPLKVVAADALAPMVHDPASSLPVSGVLLLPRRGSPGPGTWREAVGGAVALWCDSVASLTEHALELGACDAVLVPEQDPVAQRLAEALIEASAPLRS